jgi:hypothetical protein
MAMLGLCGEERVFTWHSFGVGSRMRSCLGFLPGMWLGY